MPLSIFSFAYMPQYLFFVVSCLLNVRKALPFWGKQGKDFSLVSKGEQKRNRGRGMGDWGGVTERKVMLGGWFQDQGTWSFPPVQAASGALLWRMLWFVLWGAAPLGRERGREESSFFFFFLINLFIYFWLHWVFIAARGLFLVAVSRGYSSLWCTGFSLRWLLLLRSTGSRHAGFSSCGTWAQ